MGAGATSGVQEVIDETKLNDALSKLSIDDKLKFWTTVSESDAKEAINGSDQMKSEFEKLSEENQEKFVTIITKVKTDPSAGAPFFELADEKGKAWLLEQTKEMSPEEQAKIDTDPEKKKEMMDKYRVYFTEELKPIYKKIFDRHDTDTMARAVAWSPDGAMLGVGLGGSVGRGKQKKDGAFLILDAQSKGLPVIHEARDSKQWISDVKFSPDKSTFAVGSHDNKIYLYDVANSFNLRGRCDKHNSYITHLDFSADSSHIQSNCGAYELMFYNVADGSHNNSPSSVKNVDWSTWTCVLGWPVQGVWPDSSDGTDINATHRSNNGRYVAAADDFGNVKIFNYPCVSKSNGHVAGKGHSSHVTNVRFSADDQFMYTNGGNDRSIMQWKILPKRS